MVVVLGLAVCMWSVACAAFMLWLLHSCPSLLCLVCKQGRVLQLGGQAGSCAAVAATHFDEKMFLLWVVRGMYTGGKGRRR